MLKTPFPQLQKVSVDRFDRFLRSRGIRIGRQGIEQAVSLNVIRSLDPNAPTFHPFQIWPITQFLTSPSVDPTLPVEGYSVVDSPTSTLNMTRSRDWPSHIRFQHSRDRCVEFHDDILPLLLSLGSYFLPVVRGPRPGYIRLRNCNSEEWHNWRKATPLVDLLNLHNITVEDIRMAHRRILIDAERIDPSPRLYLLLRSMPFTQRDKFEGTLRLAHDLYEIAEIVRLFLERISDAPVAKEWDPRGHPDTSWVDRLYGMQPRFGSPEFLRPLIRRYGLDPTSRVLWLVEGHTEVGFIRQYAYRLGIDIDDYIDLRNFAGDANFYKKFQVVDEELDSARREQRFVTLTFDDSRNTRSRLESLLSRQLVSMRYVLNSPDFETGNFTAEKLTEVAMKWADDVGCSIRISKSEITSRVAKRMSAKEIGFQKAFNDTVHRYGEVFKLTKNEEWGKRLADVMCDDRDWSTDPDDHLEHGSSKMEQQIIYVLRGSQPIIDFSRSLEETDFNELEISR